MTAALVILTAAIWLAAGLFLARGFGVANRPAPPSDPGARGRRAGEWVAESRTRGGRP